MHRCEGEESEHDGVDAELHRVGVSGRGGGRDRKLSIGIGSKEMNKQEHKAQKQHQAVDEERREEQENAEPEREEGG